MKFKRRQPPMIDAEWVALIAAGVLIHFSYRLGDFNLLVIALVLAIGTVVNVIRRYL